MTLRILSVFDSMEAMEWMSICLAGHELTKVKTIMSAMHVLQKDRIDVTLVQLHLQNESFFDLLRSIRRNDYYADMSFICCSTTPLVTKPQIQSDQFLEKSCLLLGATRFLQMDEFFSDSLEQMIFETIASCSRSGT